ncbi:hypothetical protein VTK73DRAFT_2359 [Phialemonium thermophilum]|uniref:Uncharacterized protein n=1 Tax=Phialemonium thermophilum TaxID=223376 RepID=A0ABR3X5K9_9PEZI
MAALIGDVFTDSARFHHGIGGVGLQHQHHQHSHSHHSHEPRYRSGSRSRDRATVSTPQRTPTWSSGRQPDRGDDGNAPTPVATPPSSKRQTTIAPSVVAPGGPSRLPSPPSSSSSSSEQRPTTVCSQHGQSPGYMASAANDPPASAQIASSAASVSTESSTSTATTVIPAGTAPSSEQARSPSYDTEGSWSDTLPHPAAGLAAGATPTQTTIRIRDLEHIKSLARADMLSGNGPGILNDPPLPAMKYEISGMPINDIIEMVAALLTKITTTNDLQHDALNRNAAHFRQAQAAASRSDDASSGEYSSPLSSSVLAFHGKNVPAITILSYLSRINKYCPTTFEVFLSLLVYFDRMTERVNDLVMKSEEARRRQQQQQHQRAQQSSRASQGPSRRSSSGGGDGDVAMRDDDSDQGDEVDSDLADDDDDDDEMSDAKPTGHRARASSETAETAAASSQQSPLPASHATYFVVDSFNIHRLIIAGVTCASKFFSDVFYTNSRYAKVGGLPLAELNHLELQFLLLNDFRLAVPVEDLEAYATMLVEFYAREVIAQRSRAATSTD